MSYSLRSLTSNSRSTRSPLTSVNSKYPNIGNNQAYNGGRTTNALAPTTYPIGVVCSFCGSYNPPNYCPTQPPSPPAFIYPPSGNRNGSHGQLSAYQSGQQRPGYIPIIGAASVASNHTVHNRGAEVDMISHDPYVEYMHGIKEPPSASNANHSPSQRLSMNDTLVEAINQPSPTVDQFPGSQPMPAPLPSYGSFRGTRIVNNFYEGVVTGVNHDNSPTAEFDAGDLGRTRRYGDSSEYPEPNDIAIPVSHTFHTLAGVSPYGYQLSDRRDPVVFRGLEGYQGHQNRFGLLDCFPDCKLGRFGTKGYPKKQRGNLLQHLRRVHGQEIPKGDRAPSSSITIDIQSGLSVNRAWVEEFSP